MENTERIIKQVGNEAVCFSCDAEAMFTQMNMNLAAQEAANEQVESGVLIENVDYRQAGLQLAGALTREEIVQAGLSKVVPRRKYTHGAKPGLTSKEAMAKLKVAANEYTTLKIMRK